MIDKSIKVDEVIYDSVGCTNKIFSRKNQRDYRLTLINCVCTLLIVCQHSIYTAWVSTDGKIYTFEKVVIHCSRIAVPIFFFISGYLWMERTNYANFLKKIVNSFGNLLIPYVFWTIVSNAIFSLMGSPIFAQYESSRVLFNFDSVVSALRYSLYTPLWYLRVLFMLRLASLAILWCKKNKTLYLAITVAFTLIGICLIPSYYGAMRWIPIFLWGVVFYILRGLFYKGSILQI